VKQLKASPHHKICLTLAYCLVSFTVLGLTVLAINLFLPSLRRRRVVAGAVGRAFLCARPAYPLRWRDLERLPKTPCVVVANHASYIDGIVASSRHCLRILPLSLRRRW
jgi:1-acyl-sn-glycerol-3-phosphate acyltransferase